MTTRYDVAARRRLIDRWHRSGESAQAFALRHKLHFTTLYRWQRELSASPAFVEVTARDESVSSPTASVAAFNHAIEITLPGGAVVRASHDAEAKLVIRVVEALA